MTFPLQDPNYQPDHIPSDKGIVPPIIARWGINSQLRWFERFHKEVFGRNDFSIFYCTSRYHRGLCCFSCDYDYEENTGVMMDGWCCCRDERIKSRGRVD